MVILPVFAEFFAHFPLHLPFQTSFTATSERTTDLHAIGRCNDPSPRPLRAQQTVALETAGQVTAKSEQRRGVLMQHGVAQAIFTERTDPPGQHPSSAFRLDLVQCGKLAGRAQKHRIKDLFPGVPRIDPPLGQSRHAIREVKHLVEIGLELVPAQPSASLSPRGARESDVD
jgi:hypothetical protein